MDPKKISMNDIKIAIANHTIFTWGPDGMLDNYLERCSELLHIRHPFDYLKKEPSSYERFERGIKIQKEQLGWSTNYTLLSYIKDFYVNISLVRKQPHNYDLFIGMDPLNAFSGLVLKRLGKVRRVVFYPIDYSPTRFKNSVLNWLYHAVESYCAKHADSVWAMSKKMLEIFVSKGAPREKCQFLYVATDKVYEENNIDRLSNPIIAYIGSLYPEKGVEMLIDSAPLLFKEFPSLKILVIGTGPLEPQLRQRAKDTGYENNIIFTGHIKSHDDAMNKLSTCTLGTLLYVPSTGLYTDAGFGGKIAEYLTCGLPVITTKVAESWKEVEGRGTGIAIDYDMNQFVNAASYLLKNEKLYKQYREASFQAAKDFYYVNVFDKAFGSMGYSRDFQDQQTTSHRD